MFQNLSTDTPRTLMDETAHHDRPLTRSERRQLMLLIGSIGAIFVVAFFLIPDPSGSGTHRQLGLPRCFVQALTGMSCPHCGLTTSFCWLVRGEVGKSLAANPSGVLLAFVFIYLGSLSLWIVGRNHWSGRIQFSQHVRNLIGLWLLLAMLLWLAG